MAARRHLVLRAVLLLAAIVCVGEAIPRYTVENNLAAYAGIPDAHAVAMAARIQARAAYPAPLGRLLFPAERVNVWVHRGNCPHAGGESASARRKYEATVQLFSIFDIRGPRLHVRCGGRESSWATST